jgi:ABC-type Fe3+/spermidine/putrescine transport system ATPase subunit
MFDVKNLNLIIDDVDILHNINFDIHNGEILSIIGPSGCGKSSILKSIAGIYKHTTGALILDGENIADKPINLRNVNLVFQDFPLFPHMTTIQNMLVACDNNRVIDIVLDEMGIKHLKFKYPHEMSGGEQQRVALARAIVYKPKLLLLDEPFSNIDVLTTKVLRHKVFNLLKQFNITTLMVTHDLDDVFEMSERCIVMKNSSIVQFDTFDNLYNYPVDEYVSTLFGNVVSYAGKNYRPENILIIADYSPNSVKTVIKNVKFKSHYNEITLELDNKQDIIVFDYYRKKYKINEIMYLNFNNPL